MYELIKKLKAFGARILETNLCKNLIKPFTSEDAEYLDQLNQNKSTRRIYDDLEIDAQSQKNNSISATAPNKKIDFVQKSADSQLRDDPENQYPIDTEEVKIFSADDRVFSMHIEMNMERFPNSDEINAEKSAASIVENLLVNEDIFVEQIVERITPKILPSIVTSNFLPQSDIEGFITISDEDEWLTPDIADAAYEEDIWEGNPPLSVAIESLPTKQELISLPDRLTRAEKALQIAIKIGKEFDWDRNGIQLLATIFNRYWWSSSQAAMRRAIESGMTPGELLLAEELRQIWHERSEFWSAINKHGEICHQYSLISWPTSLKLIRSFNGYPQIEEVEALLNECLERWMNSSSLQHSFRGFYMYVLYRVGAYDDLADQDGWIIFDHYLTDESEFANDLEQTRILKNLGVYIDPQAKRYVTNSWDGQLVLLNARHGHELFDDKEGNPLSESEDRRSEC